MSRRCEGPHGSPILTHDVCAGSAQRMQFWTTFYEQAAQIRIPTYDDYSTGQQEEDQETEATQSESESGPAESSAHSYTDSEAETPNQNRTLTQDRTSSEVSFAPGQAAISSTPATVSRARVMNQHDSFASQASEPMPSWSASLESPLLQQLNREIQDLTTDRSAAIPSTSALHGPDAYDASQDVTQRPIHPDSRNDESSIIRPTDKGKSREGPQPLLHNVLRRNANTSTATASTSRTTSPLKFKPKTPLLKTTNPYLPPDTNPSEWKGVVDLKDPSIASPRRAVPSSSIKIATFKPSAAIGTARARNKTPPPTDDDSFDENFGMSPPVMTDYARLPKLGRTPRKEAAARIMQSLVEVEDRGVFGPVGAAAQRATGGQAKGAGTGYGTESSMSSMPTPPSMTRYTRPSYAPQAASETSGSVVDASLDSIMRRVGLNVSGYTGSQVPPAAAPVFAPPSSRAPVFSSISSASSIGSMRSAASSTRVFQPPAPAPPPPPPPPPEPEPLQTPQPPQFNFYDDDVIGQGSGQDADDSMDSLDYDEPNSENPPFVFAPPEDNSFDDEDSFDSSLGDDDGPGGGVPLFVPQGDGDDGDFDDDSFDDVGYGEGEEETVFGVPPAQRLQQQGGQFRMLGEDLLQDTIGIGAQMQMAGRVEESPTPWNPNARG